MASVIHPTAVIAPGTQIGADVTIEAFTYIGFGCRAAREHLPPTHPAAVQSAGTAQHAPTALGAGTFVGPGSIIGPGTTIGQRCFIEAQTYIGEGVAIGDDCFIRYGCRICDDVVVGTCCVLSGFLCNGTVVHNRVESHASCIHGPLGTLNRPSGPPPTIHDEAFVAWGVTLVGGVSIGKKACVKAGALVSADVPEGGVVHANSRYRG